MKCSVCGSENINGELGECKDCGFEMIGWTGSGNREEYEQAVREIADDYRREMREDISVGMTVMSYRKNSEQRWEVKSEDRIVLAGAQNPEASGKIQWYPEKFARIEAGEEMTLRLFIENKDRQELHREIKMKAPDWGAVLWKIGIKEEEKLHFRVVLGADGGSAGIMESESISMVY